MGRATTDLRNELADTMDRIHARERGNPRYRSEQLTLGDRCYAAGLAYSIGVLEGLSKDEVLREYGYELKVAPKRKLKRTTTLKRKPR